MSLNAPLTFVTSQKYRTHTFPTHKQREVFENVSDPQNVNDTPFRKSMRGLYNTNVNLKTRNTFYLDKLQNRYGDAGLLATKGKAVPQGSYVLIQSQTGNLGTKKGPLNNPSRMVGGALTGGYRTNEGLQYGTNQWAKRVADLQRFKDEEYYPQLQVSQAEPQTDLNSPEMTALFLILEQVEDAISYTDEPGFADILPQKEVGKVYNIIAQNALTTPIVVLEKIFQKLINITHILEQKFFSNDYQEFNLREYKRAASIYGVLGKSRILTEIAISLQNYSPKDREVIFKALQKEVTLSKIGLQNITREGYGQYIHEIEAHLDDISAKFKALINNLSPISPALREQIDERIQEHYQALASRMAQADMNIQGPVSPVMRMRYDADENDMDQSAYIAPPRDLMEEIANIPSTPAQPAPEGFQEITGQGVSRGYAIRQEHQRVVQPGDEGEEEEYEAPQYHRFGRMIRPRPRLGGEDHLEIIKRATLNKRAIRGYRR